MDGTARKPYHQPQLTLILPRNGTLLWDKAEIAAPKVPVEASSAAPAD